MRHKPRNEAAKRKKIGLTALLCAACLAAFPLLSCAVAPGQGNTSSYSFYGALDDGSSSSSELQPGVAEEALSAPPESISPGENGPDLAGVGLGGTESIAPAPRPAIVNTPDRSFRPVLLSFSDGDRVSVDFDYDGTSETVEISGNEESGVFKLNINWDREYSMELRMASLICAYVTDFSVGDGECEVLVSYLSPDDEYVTMVVSRMQNEPIERGLRCVSCPGWVETYDGESIQLCRRVELIGERGASRRYTFSTLNSSFVPIDKEWKIYSYGEYAKSLREININAEINAEINGEYELVTLPVGTGVVPLETDFESYVLIRTDSGLTGYMDISVRDGKSYTSYYEEPMEALFEELPSW